MAETFLKEIAFFFPSSQNTVEGKQESIKEREEKGPFCVKDLASHFPHSVWKDSLCEFRKL